MFYLYDSTVLLYSNEAVLMCDRRGQWSATMGWAGFVLAGRSLCVLNPFTPFRPSFRLHWDFAALDDGAEGKRWPEGAHEFNGIAPLCLIAWLALFVVLPLGMFTDLGVYAVAPALLLLYGSIVLGLFYLRRREVLAGMGARRFWGIAFECVACPPFGVNLVRHITLAQRITEPLPLAGARLLDAPRWSKLREQCLSRIDDAMQAAAEDSTELSALQVQKQRLSELERRS